MVSDGEIKTLQNLGPHLMGVVGTLMRATRPDKNARLIDGVQPYKILIIEAVCGIFKLHYF